MTGRLVICATPIGNLNDVSPRLRETFEAVDIVYAEDTRRTRILLDYLGVSVPLRSYFVGNEEVRSVELEDRLRSGSMVALVSDAGMPGVADPGLSAVKMAVKAGADVSVVPGPSAVTAALGVAGLPADRFVFEGFLPRKRGERARRLELLMAETRTIVMFSVARRLISDLITLGDVLDLNREVVICRELTKVYEEVFRGDLAGAISRWRLGSKPRGEFTLVIRGAVKMPPRIDEVLSEVDVLVADGRTLSEAVRRVAAASGVSRRILYERVIKNRDDD